MVDSQSCILKKLANEGPDDRPQQLPFHQPCSWRGRPRAAQSLCPGLPRLQLLRGFHTKGELALPGGALMQFSAGLSNAEMLAG